MPESRFPKKTAVGAGVGFLLLLFWRGRGFGMSQGKGFLGGGQPPSQEEALAQFLTIDPKGTIPADTVTLTTVQRGDKFTGKLDATDLVLAKSGSRGGEAMTVAQLLGFGNLFRSGRFKLVINLTGDTFSGNARLLAESLAQAGIPGQIRTGHLDQSGGITWISYDVATFLANYPATQTTS